MQYPAPSSIRGVTIPPPCPEQCNKHSAGVHQYYASLRKQQAMDAAAEIDPELETQTAVAKTGERIAEERTESGNDQGEIPRLLGEQRRDVGEIKRALSEQKRDLAKLDRVGSATIALVQQLRQRCARDAAIRNLERKQRAADRREARRQQLEQQCFERTREILETPMRRALDLEPSPSAQIGELGPGDGPFAKQTRREGAVQRASNLHVTQDTRGRYIDSYADLSGDGYKTAAGKLRGQDVQPRDVCEQMQMEHKRARQRLEARPTP